MSYDPSPLDRFAAASLKQKAQLLSDVLGVDPRVKIAELLGHAGTSQGRIMLAPMARAQRRELERRKQKAK